MKASDIFGGLGIVALAGLILAAFIGWVLNIVGIVQTVNDPVTGVFILRCFGVVFAPLGAVLGYV